MYAIYNTPYLDKIKKCYYHILIIEPRPTGDLLQMVKNITIPNVIEACSHCKSMSECVYVFKSIQHPGQLMTLNESVYLFNALQELGLQVNTDLTKTLIKTQLKDEYRTLLCYIQ